MAAGWVGAVLFYALGLLSLTLAVFVRKASPRGSPGRAVALLLAIEALFAAANGYLRQRPETTTDGLAVLLTLFLTFYLISLLYVRVVATLDTPMTRGLKSARSAGIVKAGIVMALLVWIAIEIGTLTGRLVLDTSGPGSEVASSIPLVAWIAVGLFAVISTSTFGLVAAISAYRRAPRQSAARRRARAFLFAFGTRDAVFILTLLVAEIIAELVPSVALQVFFQGRVDDYIIGVGFIVYVLALAYGMLREQLFDLDLKIKTGISRSTVAGIILVAVFVGAKIVESYLDRTAGFIAGSAVAGTLLFVVPKLNKVGEKVANTAMPQVQPTSGYVQFKKLEVYRAAVESAHETGGIDARQRLTLDRLRTKLTLSESDCRAVEAEVVPG